MADGRRQRILIVSNDEQQFVPVRELLEHDGYTIWSTWSGREALQEMESKHFDAVVVDDYVPDLYVGQFIEGVSRMPSHPCLILVQAHHPRADVQNLGPPGAFCVVEKAQPAQLVEAVELAMQRRSPGRDLKEHSTGNGKHS